MNRKIVIALTVSVVLGIMCVGFASAYTPVGRTHVTTKQTKTVFRGPGLEMPWLYVYVSNPTWQTVDVNSVSINTYVNGVFHPELSYHVTPDWQPERWDTKVLPFEKSVIVWFGNLVEEGDPEGSYVINWTVYATIMGEDIELKTRSTYKVFL